MSQTTKVDMRTRIIDAALATIEADGQEALSMRTLASLVGVSATTIYWHVGSREEVLRAAVSRFAERIGTTPVHGKNSHDRVMSILRQVRSLSIDNLNISRAALDLGMQAKLQMPSQTALAHELTACGLRGQHLADVMRGLLYTAGGFVVVTTRQRMGALGSEHEWSKIHDETIDDEALHALSRPVEPDHHFEEMMMAFIRAVVPLTS